MIWLAFDRLDVAEPLFEVEEVASLLNQFASLVSEQPCKDMEALHSVLMRVQKHPEQQVAQMKDKDNEGVAIGCARQQLLEEDKRTLLIDCPEQG